MGRIVDDAIVILDNMVRRLQENKDKPVLGILASAVVEMLPGLLLQQQRRLPYMYRLP